ncbi:retrovirus-related pol polyprotein from transposon TNT 1-94, partial [Tanacetum coccineum]
MLADSKLPITFWAKAVSTACYIQNRVLVVKPHNKTPYELFRGFKPALSFIRPFGCHVTILITLDSLGKFNGKSDEGFFVGYSLNSKAFRVQVLMILQKNTTYFDSPSKDVSHDEPKSSFDDQEQAKDGPNDENTDQDKSVNNSSPKEDNTTKPQVNTASPGFNTGSSKLKTVVSLVNTTSPKDKLGD